MTIGTWLKQTRESAGLSQPALGAHLGVRQAAVSAWEVGRNEISRADLVRVFEVLGVPESEWAAVLRLPRELAEPAGAAA